MLLRMLSRQQLFKAVDVELNVPSAPGHEHFDQRSYFISFSRVFSSDFVSFMLWANPTVKGMRHLVAG